MYRTVGFNLSTTGPSGRRPARGRPTGLHSAYRMPRFSTRGRPRIFSPEINKPIEICYSIPDTRRLGPKPLEDILTPEVIQQRLTPSRLRSIRGRSTRTRSKPPRQQYLRFSMKTRSSSTLDSLRDSKIPFGQFSQGVRTKRTTTRAPT